MTIPAWRPRAFAAVAAFAIAPPLAAQTTPDSRIRSALDRVKSDNAWTLDQQISLCQIPAPPFGEQARGEEFRKRLMALGFPDVRVDSVGNVIAKRVGTGHAPTVVLAGHLDTVFPTGTDVTVRRTGTKLQGPGIGDDCRGLATVLAVGRALQRGAVTTTGTIILVGDVGEEGPGNARGMRHLFGREMPHGIDYFISVDGEGLSLVSRGVGSIRYRVTYSGPGGHSYGAFGIPNPIHAMGRAIGAISDLQVPASPKTTFNVGVVSGGTSVNSIASSGKMEIDMRSESPEALAALDAQVLRILVAARDAENARWKGTATQADSAAIRVRVDTIGIRPANSTQGSDAPIVAAALSTASTLGFSPTPEAASTDANIPMSLGIPAITIGGGGDGGDAHATTEWYDDGDRGWVGPQWALLLVTSLANGTAAGASSRPAR